MSLQSYTCQISAYKPTTISHNVTVRTEPVISLGQGPEVTVTEGDTLSLDCKLVSGNHNFDLLRLLSTFVSLECQNNRNPG